MIHTSNCTLNIPPTAENELRWVFSYDAIGNLKTYADWEYEWEAGRQLVKQTQNEKVVTYDYDYNGMMKKHLQDRKINNQRILWIIRQVDKSIYEGFR